MAKLKKYKDEKCGNLNFPSNTFNRRWCMFGDGMKSEKPKSEPGLWCIFGYLQVFETESKPKGKEKHNC